MAFNVRRDRTASPRKYRCKHEQGELQNRFGAGERSRTRKIVHWHNPSFSTKTNKGVTRMKTNARNKSHSSQSSQGRENMRNAEKPVSEMTEKAMRNYEQALRTSMKLQEEAGRWWSTTLNQTAST